MSHDKKKPTLSIVRPNRLGLKTETEKDAMVARYWKEVALAKIQDALEEKKVMKEFLDEKNTIQ